MLLNIYKCLKFLPKSELYKCASLYSLIDWILPCIIHLIKHVLHEHNSIISIPHGMHPISIQKKPPPINELSTFAGTIPGAHHHHNDSSCSSGPDSPNNLHQDASGAGPSGAGGGGGGLPGTGSGGGGPSGEASGSGRAQYVSATCVVFTHYSGDSASVVDEHFSRALNFSEKNNKGKF